MCERKIVQTCYAKPCPHLIQVDTSNSQHRSKVDGHFVRKAYSGIGWQVEPFLVDACVLRNDARPSRGALRVSCSYFDASEVADLAKCDVRTPNCVAVLGDDDRRNRAEADHSMHFSLRISGNERTPSDLRCRVIRANDGEPRQREIYARDAAKDVPLSNVFICCRINVDQELKGRVLGRPRTRPLPPTLLRADALHRGALRSPGREPRLTK